MLEIFWLGATKILVHAKDAKVGFNLAKTDGVDLLVFSTAQSKIKLTDGQFLIDSPGEYEIKGATVYSLIGVDGKISQAFQLIVDSISCFYCENFEFLPTQDQLDDMGTIDVAFVPVGTTKEAENHAMKLVELIEPRIIIPIGGEEEVSDKVCHDLAKQLGLKCDEPLKSLKIKSRKDLPEETQEYVFLKQNS